MTKEFRVKQIVSRVLECREQCIKAEANRSYAYISGDSIERARQDSIVEAARSNLTAAQSRLAVFVVLNPTTIGEIPEHLKNGVVNSTYVS